MMPKPKFKHIYQIHRKRDKSLGVPELVAIALGGMIGGGIFSILGISVSLVGPLTPLAIILGGGIAYLAAYSYVKLAIYYVDEGATYSFFKRTFPHSGFAASLIGWWVIFGYISTLALYAYTFASYAIGGFGISEQEWTRKAIAGCVISFFALINIWSVKGMGKIEDIIVYTKLVILVVIAFVLINNSNASLPELLNDLENVKWINIFIVSSITFVAYEGFQLVINAVKEIEEPKKEIPIAVYLALALAILIYVIIAIGAILAIPTSEIIQNKEYALASGANHSLGHWGTDLVILGALLATSSAISGTVFGASRQVAVIAADGYFPSILARRKGNIPIPAIIAMSCCAFGLILAGNLKVILEFGSITFLIVSLLMAFANFKIRHLTKSSVFATVSAFICLLLGTLFIIYFEVITQVEQLFFIGGFYVVLTLGALGYSRYGKKPRNVDAKDVPR